MCGQPVDHRRQIGLGDMQERGAGPDALEGMLPGEILEPHLTGWHACMLSRCSNHRGRGIEGLDLVAQKPEGQRIPA